VVDQQRLKVQDLGEQGLLARLLPFCPAAGDDGAVVPIAAQHAMVVTSDVLVDGVHFSDRTTPPYAVGWRATAANLSDLAAMGATPIGMTVGLSLPGETQVDWVEELYRGMTACLAKHGGAIVGGDICRSAVVTVAITAFGEVMPERAIYRHTAKVGDAIVVTGVHGASRAGLELLLNPAAATGLSAGDREYLIAKHQFPQPRLDWVAELAGAVGMDSSDGLADAIVQICRASGVGAAIDRASLPMPDCFAGWLSAERAIEWTLYGGEDFELVVCLAMERAMEMIGKGGRIVGRITAGRSVVLVDGESQTELALSQSFQHF
jgi:thiamine-monophosphate kinase